MKSLLSLAQSAAILVAVLAAPLAHAAAAAADAAVVNVPVVNPPVVNPPAVSPPATPWPHVHTLGLGVIVSVNAFFLLALIFVALALRGDATWSLGGALSESTEWSPPASSSASSGFAAAPAPTATDPSSVPRHEASSSRLIAFIGMLAIIFVFLGFADWVIWKCFTADKVPGEISNLLAFLCGGASLFVPYGLNQFRTAFETFTATPKR